MVEPPRRSGTRLQAPPARLADRAWPVPGQRNIGHDIADAQSTAGGAGMGVEPEAPQSHEAIAVARQTNIDEPVIWIGDSTFNWKTVRAGLSPQPHYSSTPTYSTD